MTDNEDEDPVLRILRETGKTLYLRAPDTGVRFHTRYDMIDHIPTGVLSLGDILIVTHPTEKGLMLMQVAKRNANGGWHLDDVGVPPDAELN